MVASKLNICLADHEDDWKAIRKIRREVFIEGDGEPEEEQWDGNDYGGAAHFIMTYGGTPIGCMRIRPVNSHTVMWERMVILPEYHSLKNLNLMASNARTYSGLYRGYSEARAIIHDRRLLKYWLRFGFKLTGEEPSYFRGHDYVPIRLKLEGVDCFIPSTDYCLSSENERYTQFLDQLHNQQAA